GILNDLRTNYYYQIVELSSHISSLNDNLELAY
ncbi:unnamed protein product, partial [marine sediment metagenome]